jgi:hypothetical protein
MLISFTLTMPGNSGDMIIMMIMMIVVNMPQMALQRSVKTFHAFK